MSVNVFQKRNQQVDTGVSMGVYYFLAWVDMLFYQFRDSQCGDCKTVVKRSYIHNWNSYVGLDSILSQSPGDLPTSFNVTLMFLKSGCLG